MVEKRRGLGRGLGALISGSPSTDEDNKHQVDNVPSHSSGDAAASSPSPTTSREPKATTTNDSLDSVKQPTGTRESTKPATSTVSRETSPKNTGPAAEKPGSASASKTKSGAKSSEASKSDPESSKALDIGKSGDEVTGKTSSPATPAQRKSRPVDMFFTPGRAETEENQLVSQDTSSERKNSVNRNRRVAVPDVLGKVRTPREVASASLDGEDMNPSPSKTQSQLAAETATYEAPVEEGKSTASEDEVSRETFVAVPGATFAEVDVGSIHPNRKQPRTVFDEEEMAELVHSIREVGLLQPIVVRPSDEEGDQKYELVMGERRWRAVQEAGLATIPAIVRETSDTALLRDALLENLHRAQLNPLEEAAAYQQLMQEFDCTQDELSERIGRSRPQISNTIRLMRLPALVQRRVAAGVLSAGHARALLGLEDVADMERLAQRIVNEGLSVRATEENVAMNDGLRRKSRDKTPRSTARHERLDYLANSLSDHLETNVKISLGAKKGRVSIEFGSVEDLNRIMEVIAPSAEQ